VIAIKDHAHTYAYFMPKEEELQSVTHMGNWLHLLSQPPTCVGIGYSNLCVAMGEHPNKDVVHRGHPKHIHVGKQSPRNISMEATTNTFPGISVQGFGEN